MATDMAPALPIRNGTETGETSLIVNIADATTPAQILAIDASGKAAVTGILHDATTPAQTLAIDASGQAATTGILHDATTPAQTLVIDASGKAAVTGIIHDATTPAQTLVVDANGAASVGVFDSTGNRLAITTATGRLGGIIHDATTDGNTLGINLYNAAQATLENADGTARDGRQAIDHSLSVVQATSEVFNVNVVSSISAGSAVNSYKESAALASTVEGFVEYAPGAAFKFNQIQLAASAAMKFEVWTGLAAIATVALIRSGGIQLMSAFSTAASPCLERTFDNDVAIAATDSVYVIFTNRDNQSQSGYATISGYLA